LIAAFLVFIALRNHHALLAAVWTVVGATNVWIALRGDRGKM
jgi:hypothetical protein